MKKTITFLVFTAIALQVMAYTVEIDGPIGVCPGSTHTYSVEGDQGTTVGDQDWYVTGGVFTENGMTVIRKPANTVVQVTWGNTPLLGNIFVFNPGDYSGDLNVDIGTFLNLLSPGSATIYQQTDFSAYKGNTLGTLTWTAQSGSVVWSNSDATWVKIVFYGYGNKLVTVQGTDAVCGTVYTD
jgi:hypothetical protein